MGWLRCSKGKPTRTNVDISGLVSIFPVRKMNREENKGRQTVPVSIWPTRYVALPPSMSRLEVCGTTVSHSSSRATPSVTLVLQHDLWSSTPLGRYHDQLHTRPQESWTEEYGGKSEARLLRYVGMFCSLYIAPKWGPVRRSLAGARPQLASYIAILEIHQRPQREVRLECTV